MLLNIRYPGTYSDPPGFTFGNWVENYNWEISLRFLELGLKQTLSFIRFLKIGNQTCGSTHNSKL